MNLCQNSGPGNNLKLWFQLSFWRNSKLFISFVLNFFRMTVKMDGSVKLFQFIQKFHQTLGIYPPQLKQQPYQINSINKIFLVCLVQMIITTTAFLMFEAESMFSYGLAFFVLIAMINGVVIYLTFIWQFENTVKYIGNCEEFIVKSKYCSEHGQACEMALDRTLGWRRIHISNY